MSVNTLAIYLRNLQLHCLHGLLVHALFAPFWGTIGGHVHHPKSNPQRHYPPDRPSCTCHTKRHVLIPTLRVPQSARPSDSTSLHHYRLWLYPELCSLVHRPYLKPDTVTWSRSVCGIMTSSYSCFPIGQRREGRDGSSCPFRVSIEWSIIVQQFDSESLNTRPDFPEAKALLKTLKKETIN